MKPTLTEQERKQLDERVADAEKRTGAQIVLAFVARSDVYAELPWKAFALGAGTAGFGATLFDLLQPAWTTSHTILLAITAVLGAGAACALLCITVPAFARVFLDSFRTETEVRQYAESLFLSRQLFSTANRTGILLVVSLFERRAVIIPDAGLKNRLSVETGNRICSELTPVLATGRVKNALEQGLAGLVEALKQGPAGAEERDELPNAVIEGEGA